MSLVFSAGDRKQVEFEYEFKDGSKKKFIWREMNAKSTGEFLSALNQPDKLISTAGDILLDSIDGEGKEKLVEELFENASVETIFSMVNRLNEEVGKEIEKK